MNEKTHIATDIPTEIFYKMVDFLKANNWKLIAEYSPEIIDSKLIGITEHREAQIEINLKDITDIKFTVYDRD